MQWFCLLAIAAYFFAFAPAAQADSGWTIRSFDSQIVLEPDGHLDITETIVADFGFIAKHGIYRDIPTKYDLSEGGEPIYTTLSDVSVAQDNAEAVTDISKYSEYQSIRIGDEDKTITGRHTYKIHYKMLGALRNFGSYDEITWDVTGNDWEIPIENVTATVTLPSGEIIQAACYEGFPGSTAACQTAIQSNEPIARFTASRDFVAGEGMTVSVGYPAGLAPIVVVPRPPTALEQASNPGAIISFILLMVVGSYVLVSRYLKFGRDAVGNPIKTTIVPEYEPPAKMRPAVLGVLIDENADTIDVTATIIDLASRGFLTIEEVPKKWLFGQTDYIMRRTKAKATSLHSYESRLLSALFESGDEVSLSSLKNNFYTEMNAILDSLYSTIMKSDLFNGDPQSVRSAYYVAGFFMLVLGFMGSIFSLNLFPPLALVAVALALLGIATLLFGKAMPSRTANGRELYRQTLGYKLFIETAEKYRARFAENENLFNEILPYAIVFGVTKKFAKAMADMGLKPTSPSWYTGIHPFNPVVFASDVDTFSHSLSSAMVSSPSSSGGGGSSGGGFGGGGGGSW